MIGSVVRDDAGSRVLWGQWRWWLAVAAGAWVLPRWAAHQGVFVGQGYMKITWCVGSPRQVAGAGWLLVMGDYGERAVAAVPPLQDRRLW